MPDRRSRLAEQDIVGNRVHYIYSLREYLGPTLAKFFGVGSLPLLMGVKVSIVVGFVHAWACCRMGRLGITIRLHASM